jgi:hypothetical protein
VSHEYPVYYGIGKGEVKMPKFLIKCNAIKATGIGGTLHAFKTLSIRGDERSNSNIFSNL